MTSRYINSELINNRDNDFKDNFESRFENRNNLQHLETGRLDYPELQDLKEFNYVYHVWKSGDRLYKLADQYYGNPKYWWVIAKFNKKPTEQHFTLGDVVSIPLSLDDVLETMGVL